MLKGWTKFDIRSKYVGLCWQLETLRKKIIFYRWKKETIKTYLKSIRHEKLKYFRMLRGFSLKVDIEHIYNHHETFIFHEEFVINVAFHWLGPSRYEQVSFKALHWTTFTMLFFFCWEGANIEEERIYLKLWMDSTNALCWSKSNCSVAFIWINSCYAWCSNTERHSISININTNTHIKINTNIKIKPNIKINTNIKLMSSTLEPTSTHILVLSHYGAIPTFNDFCSISDSEGFIESFCPLLTKNLAILLAQCISSSYSSNS